MEALRIGEIEAILDVVKRRLALIFAMIRQKEEERANASATHAEGVQKAKIAVLEAGSKEVRQVIAEEVRGQVRAVRGEALSSILHTLPLSSSDKPHRRHL